MAPQNKKQHTLTENELTLLSACLILIRQKMDVSYWNAMQKEMDSPFDNSGRSYSNRTFSVKAYGWEGNTQPNFKYKELSVWWYKHSGRGLYAAIGKKKLKKKFLEKMLRDCLKSLHKEKWKNEK